MEPPSNHLTSPYGSPPCPPMYGPNTDYNLQHKMQDQYYPDRQQGGMGYPGLVPSQTGQTYPSMAMEQSKIADPSYSGGSGYARPPADLGPMMRALTEDDLYNQHQQPQQAQYRQMSAGMAYGPGQNMSYSSQENVPGYGTHSAAGQYTSPFSPGHSPRSSQFFPMHSQSASPHDGYTSPPVQSSHFGPNGPLGQFQRQSPLMNMASPNGQSSPSVPSFSRGTNHPVTAPSPVMGIQGSNSSMYSSHGNSGPLSHSPLPSPSNLRSPASVHSPKSLPATSPNTFASPSPSPVGSMAGQSHRQTRSPGASGPFQQNPAPQPYPIPSPKVRAVEQVSTVSGNTPYVELVSTRDSPQGSASNHSQESITKAPYPPKEHSSNRGHLPQLEEMVKFLGEPTAKGILPLCEDKDKDKNVQPKEVEADVNGRNCFEGKINNSDDTASSKMTDNSESQSVSPANVEVRDPIGTSNGPTESPVTPNIEDNIALQQKYSEFPNVVNSTPNGPDHPVKKSPRRRNSSKSPKRRDSLGQDSPLMRENHIGDDKDRVSSPGQMMQNADLDNNSPSVIKRRRSSSGEWDRRRQGSGNNSRQKSPKRRNSLKKSDDEMNSKGSPLISSEPLQASPKNNKLPRSPRRLSAEKPDRVPEEGPNGEINASAGKNNPSPGPKRTDECTGDSKSPNGAKSDSDGCVNEENRTIDKNQEQNCGGSEPVKETGENTPEKSPQDTSKSADRSEEGKSESQNTSPMDGPSTSRSVTPTFRNPMTTPTLKRNTPESGGSSDMSNPNKKRRGRPPGSKNRTKEEIEKDKLTKKRGPYKKRSLDPELKGELGKFKHLPKAGKPAENKISAKGPVLRIQGTLNNVVSSKVLNCPQNEQSSQSVAGKKQKKKPGRVAKRYSSMTRVPQGPATMHASEFRPSGEWVCALCGKASNIGTLGHLYGPYYPHGYQIPPQPPKPDSTLQAKEEVEEVPPPSKGKGTRTRLKSNSPPPRGRNSKRVVKQTPQSKTRRPARSSSKGASGKRTPKTAKMEDFDYEYETPSATKGGQRRQRSLTPGSSSRRPAKASPEPPESGRRRRKSAKDDPSRPDPNEIWVHEDCAIWAQGVYAMGNMLYGLYEAVMAARKVECVKCSEKGASMGCLSKGCKMVYHFMCAQQAGCQLQEENYSMICPEHKDKMVKMRDVT